MSKTWPILLLGEVLKERQEIPSTEALAKGEIRIVAKIGFNDGKIQLRSGSETKTGMILGRPGDLLISGINAAKGAIAIYGEENTQPIAATIHYGAYMPNKARVNVKYLWWLLRSGTFRDLLYTYVPGGIKTELKAKRLLPIPVPLPSIEAQRRIVAKIDELAAKIEEARTLRQQTVEESERLLISMAHRHDLNSKTKEREDWKWVSLSEVLLSVDDSHRVEAERTYPNLGIYSFGRGLFKKQPIDGALTSATTLRRVRKGQFVYSRLFAFEGAYGMVTDDYDGFFVSNEYPTFDCVPSRIRAEFLWAHFKWPAVWKEVAVGSKGLGDRRQRVQPTQLLSYRLWLPPLEWQNRIAEVQAEVDALKRVQTETTAELDALLPSILDKAFKGEL